MTTSALRLVLVSAGAGFGAALAFVAGLVTTDPAGLGGWTGGVGRLLGLWVAVGAAFTAAQLGLAAVLRPDEAAGRHAAVPIWARRDH